MKIQKASSIPEKHDVVILSKDVNHLKELVDTNEFKHIKEAVSTGLKTVTLNRLTNFMLVHIYEAKPTEAATKEALRKAGHDVYKIFENLKREEIALTHTEDYPVSLIPFLEGFVLSSYQYLRYSSEKLKKLTSVNSLKVLSDELEEKSINKLNILIQAVFTARDLVNTPNSDQSPEDLAAFMETHGKKAGLKVEVLTKKKIEALKMGGILAVNRGSKEPPAFTILEWKPKSFKNKKPLVLVGKGVVYDTGGVSLKTAAGMETMKCDMAGAAAVYGTMEAIANMKLPVHVIGLIPSSDNRTGEDAYVPGDILTLHNGVTVEVLNTDAEGRLILGDALSYASKYHPELVIDLATLTGAAVAAVGNFGSVMMGTADKITMDTLVESGFEVHERLAPFPFWDDYDELIKSDIADIKNLGGPYGGAITAGKFLQRFTNYPWIHLDIAGPAYNNIADSYRGKGGTGTGIRLLIDFLHKHYNL